MTRLTPDLKQYLLVTGNYWAFTLTDGALRMLVVLYFYQLGYSPLQIATLFLLYEIFGVITNLVGGYLGARIGLNRTMHIGLGLQVLSLLMLAVPAGLLTVPWVMSAQALSGIAKDLNKMSAKSSIKQLVAAGQNGLLFKWVALLTGSKNALKGVGFFLGGLLLALLTFKGAVIAMAAALALVWLGSLFGLKKELGKAKQKPKFRELFSKSPAINVLSAARLFLFGARDIWFVVALPVYLSMQLHWSVEWVGAFLALWVIGYGVVQSLAPPLLRRAGDVRRKTLIWAWLLAAVPVLMAWALGLAVAPETVLVVGLIAFGAVFAINSSLHSYLIVRFADADAVSLDVGFYYMANAMGRLVGTLLSGVIYELAGMTACLWVSGVFVVCAALISLRLPPIRD